MKKLIIITTLFVFLIFITIIAFLSYTSSNSNPGRIVYYKGGSLLSTSLNGEQTTDLSKLGAQGNPIFVSKNKMKMYFVRDSNIWSANTDGSQLKQITKNVTIEPPFDISLIGANDDGTKLLFSYELPDIMGIPDANRYIKYGVHYYDAIANRFNYIDQRLFNKEGAVYYYVGFIDNVPIYAQILDGYYYKLDPINNKLSKYTRMPIPAIASTSYFNIKKNILIYDGHYANQGQNIWKDSAIPDLYSQIVLVSLDNYSKTYISLAGDYAEYQYLSVSPNFENVIYGHQMGGSERAYYSYNINSRHTKPLSKIHATYLVPLWLDDETFLYADQKPLAILYKYDLKTDAITKYIENIDYYTIPDEWFDLTRVLYY
ncbi:MAG: hypothetical protein WC500_06045 [Candidatus Margulisiibacteriota bacterium]